MTGQLINETWSNIGVRWEPNNQASDDVGGLELFVNAKKVGHSIFPLEKPSANWIEGGQLIPSENDDTWNVLPYPRRPPVLMVGCHRNEDSPTFEYFGDYNSSFDELAIWTRKLRVNRTHDETLLFLDGYSEFFVKSCT